MQRGDVVTVAAAGDDGKPRPAVIVQSDAFPETHASVVICQLTSALVDAPDFRVTIEPNAQEWMAAHIAGDGRQAGYRETRTDRAEDRGFG